MTRRRISRAVEAPGADDLVHYFIAPVSTQLLFRRGFPFRIYFSLTFSFVL